MNFNNDKVQALAKIDKSKKGNIDEPIEVLVNLINKHPDFYTTSSCSGRIMLTSLGIKKYEFNWLFVSHDKVDVKPIKEALCNTPNEIVWLRQEPPILHICAKNLDIANNLLNIANDSGFRRSSLLSFKKRIIIEIMIPEKMDVPLSKDGIIMITDDYLNFVLEQANHRLEQAHKKLKKFEKLFLDQYY